MGEDYRNHIEDLLSKDVNFTCFSEEYSLTPTISFLLHFPDELVPVEYSHPSGFSYLFLQQVRKVRAGTRINFKLGLCSLWPESTQQDTKPTVQYELSSGSYELQSPTRLTRGLQRPAECKLLPAPVYVVLRV